MPIMNSLKIAENIAHMRRKKGITQEELASFLGVTKASVSKWENGQSMPDILLLPELATYFGISVDELLGYEPQLSREQIQKLYGELGEDFATLPFEEAFAKSEALVKKYYSCYRFLLQIAILWLNHYVLAEQKERQQEILVKMRKLCDRIIEECTDDQIYSDALGIRACIDFCSGRSQDVIDGIAGLLNPQRVLNQSDGVLIQAYLMNGEPEKADSYAQASTFLHILLAVANSIYFIGMHIKEREVCEETIARVDALIRIYHLDELNPNVAANYYFQTAAYYAVHGEDRNCMDRLQMFTESGFFLLEKGMLHGDSYFDKLESWVETLDLGVQMPRSPKLVLQSMRTSLGNPVFDKIREKSEFKEIERRIKEAKL